MRKINLLDLPSTKVARWYLSLEYFWPVSALVLLPTVLAEIQTYTAVGTKEAMLISGLHNQDMKDLVIKWIVIKLCAVTTLYLFLLLMKIYFQARNIKALKASTLVALGVIGGIFNGLVQKMLIQVLDVFEAGTTFSRITAPITLAVVLLFGLSILTSNIRKYRVQAKKAEDETRALRSVKFMQQEILLGFREHNLAISTKVNESATDALNRLSDLGSYTSMLDSNFSSEIRRISDSTIRDLSHEIAGSYQDVNSFEGELTKSEKGINLFRLFRDSINFAPLNPFAISFGFVFVISGAMIRHADFRQAITIVAGVFCVIYIIQLASSYLYRLFGLQNIYTVLVTTLIAGYLPPFLIYRNFLHFQHLVPDIEKYPPASGLFMLTLIVLTFVGYIQQAGLLASEDILKSRKQFIINTKIASKPYSKEIAQISRNWARHLHGRVQSQIMAATFEIENAQEKGDAAAVERALQQIIEVFKHANQLDVQASKTLMEAIELRTGQWSGLLEIDLRVAPEFASRGGVEILTITDVVEEMITNASRHGKATKIRIELERHNPTQMLIRSIDNGTHFEKKKRGFGSRFFEEVSEGRWNISRNPAFAETTVAVLLVISSSHNYSIQHRSLAPGADFYRP